MAYSIDEVATLLDISYRHVTRLIASGELDSFDLSVARSKRLVRVRHESIAKLIESRTLSNQPKTKTKSAYVTRILEN